MDDDSTQVIARADGVLGELVLRRRGEVVDLVVGGVFLMDTQDGSTETLLAQRSLAGVVRSPSGGVRVLVGGLGLGFTAAAVLRDARVRDVLVVEIEPALTGWLRAGLVPGAAALFDDPRLRVVHGDVLQVLRALPAGSVDAVLLDVDNGPRFLTHPSNAALYEVDGVATAARALAPGGVLTVWSADRAPGLHAVLGRHVGPTEEVPITVRRGGRDLEYLLYVARRG